MNKVESISVILLSSSVSCFIGSYAYKGIRETQIKVANDRFKRRMREKALDVFLKNPQTHNDPLISILNSLNYGGYN